MSGKLVKAGAMIFIITLISKILGFLRETFIAYYYGTSIESDAFFVALTPATLTITFSLSLSSVFLPLFIKYSENKQIAFDFSNRVISLFLGISIVVYAFVFLKGDTLVKLIAPGMDKIGIDMAVKMLEILFPVVFLTIVIQLYTVMLNSYDNYVIPAASILPNNLLIILYFIFMGDQYGIFGVSTITFFGFLLQFLILYLWLRKYKYVFKPNGFLDPKTNEFLLLLLPILVSTGFSQLNAIVDRLLASTLEEGSISALMYSYKLRTLILGIFVTGIISVTAPKISRLAFKQELLKMGDVTRESLLIVYLLLAPLCGLFMIFSYEMIEVLFQRGEFDTRATENTASIFFFSIIAILATGFREVMIRTFYALGDTKTPTKILIISLILNMILSFIFIKIMGLAGLGVSLSIAMIYSTFMISYSLSSKTPGIWKSKLFFTSITKITVASIIPTVVIFNLYNYIFVWNLEGFFIKLSLLIGYSSIYFIIYILLLVLIKVEVLMEFVDSIMRKIKKG